ncbi:MAG TPA: AmmeMemoRadiSam system protein B [Thermoanaerobaculia bacterium]|nr:AmmeMemoRadiSam system protein B [Thermoanaerobaculia bacterium]
MSETVRLPAVAGLFYEGGARALRAEVEGYLSAATGPRLSVEAWRALLLPHAGHVYSGGICAEGVGAVELPSTVLLIGPNHHGEGAGVALSDAPAWRSPLGDVPVARALVEELVATGPPLRLDSRAHQREHSLEVIVPFLQLARPDVSIAFLSLGEPDLEVCLGVGRAVARAVTRLEAGGERVALVVSSDLNHYLPREKNREKDDRALEALLGSDPVELFERVLLRERISMCGVLAATALLEALRHLPATQARLVARGDSGDAFGDTSRVVGYAAVLWESRKPAGEMES